MANYAQLSTNSYNKDDTRYAQELLNKAGGYNLTVDGIYGQKTDAAVRNFQRNNGLAVDGILGKNTWSKLLSSKTTTPSAPSTPAVTPAVTKAPDYAQYAYDIASDTAYQKTMAAAEQAYAQAQSLENPYPAYLQQLQQIYDSYANRNPFSYDPTTDPMYQQYRDMYTRQGQLAMMDTLGQAAALTGGYGNSYAQNAGQQAYQGYLQQLNAMLPQFYGMALDNYNAQGDAILNQYSLMDNMAQQEYANYQQALNAALAEGDRLYGQAQDIYSRNSSDWYNAQQLGMTADNTAYARMQDARDYITSMISLGYRPTDADLSGAKPPENWIKQTLSSLV